MPNTIRNEYDKKLTYKSLMEAHFKSRKGKGYNTSFACLKNRGMHRSAQYVQQVMRKAKEKFGNRANGKLLSDIVKNQLKEV